MILGFTLRKREGYHSCLSLMAFRIKPPIIAIGIETEKETDKDMKKEFEKPTVEIVKFDNEDVITTSGEPEVPIEPAG